jgi:hypothetical protein
MGMRVIATPAWREFEIERPNFVMPIDEMTRVPSGKHEIDSEHVLHWERLNEDFAPASHGTMVFIMV